MSRLCRATSCRSFERCFSCGETTVVSPPETVSTQASRIRNSRGTGTKCLACRRSGSIDVCDRTNSLIAIFRRVIEFYRLELGIDLLPLIYNMVSGLQSYINYTEIDGTWDVRILRFEGSIRDKAVQEAIKIHVVEPCYFEMNRTSAYNIYGMHQLARCDCRLLVQDLANQELCRWIQGIYIIGGLAFEAVGGILAHELMHGYMWLKKAQGETQEFDEAVCNLVALKFLKKEASLLERAVNCGDGRWQVRHRLNVCLYRIKKLRELEADPLYYEQLLRAKQLLLQCRGSFYELVRTLARSSNHSTPPLTQFSSDSSQQPSGFVF